MTTDVYPRENCRAPAILYLFFRLYFFWARRAKIFNFEVVESASVPRASNGPPCRALKIDLWGRARLLPAAGRCKFCRRDTSSILGARPTQSRGRILRRGEIAVRGAAHGRCPDLRCRVGARPGGARPGRFTRVEVPRLPPLAYDHPERGAAIPLRAGKQLSRSVASRAIRRANEEWLLGPRSRVLGCTHSYYHSTTIVVYY
jgi:hypothetical protein